MLTRIHVRNFRILEDVALDLPKLTVLVGPNGCGKSTVLEAVQFLTNLTVARAEERSRTDGRLGLALEQFLPGGRRRPDSEPSWPVYFAGTFTERGLAQNVAVDVMGLRPNPSASVRIDDVSLHLPTNSSPDDVSAHFGRIRSPTHAIALRLDAEAIAQPSHSLEDVPALRRSGGGLASVLAYLASTDRARLEAIEESLQAIVPQARRIRTPPYRVEVEESEQVRVDDTFLSRRVRRQHAGHRIELEMAGVGPIIAPLLSVGTLTSLALLTALHMFDEPRLLLLDDVELGLHPVAQSNLMRRMLDLQNRDPGLQVLCTTHSPYVLDAVDPQSVWVFDVDEGSHVSAAPLTLAPDFDRWKAFLPGEHWSALGERWVRSV